MKKKAELPKERAEQKRRRMKQQLEGVDHRFRRRRHSEANGCFRYSVWVNKIGVLGNQLDCSLSQFFPKRGKVFHHNIIKSTYL
nr:hypothetical protein Iba_chr07eCG7360 [Ipomoea batatas]